MCEYDALPEIGHACGHNIIAQIGIGAGLAVKKALEKKTGRDIGKVLITQIYFIFTIQGEVVLSFFITCVLSTYVILHLDRNYQSILGEHLAH